MTQPHSHPHDHDHHHGHDHAHDHAPAVTRANERKVLLSFYLIFAFMLVEVAGGIVSGSLALLADAGHMLTDAVALALAYAAFRYGRRAADDKRSFGYLRFEVIAGFVNAITLFGIVLWILVEAWQRLREPQAVLAGPMLAVAVAGLLANALVFWILTRGDSDHVNIRGAVLHVLGDLLGSAGAVIAAIVIHFTGWMPIDPILSVLVAALVLTTAWRLMRDAAHVLLEGTPPQLDRDSVARDLEKSVPGLREVHHMHVWSMDGSRVMATLHACLDDGVDAYEAVSAVKARLAGKHGIEHATVEAEYGRCADGEGDHDRHHGSDSHGHGPDNHGHDHGDHETAGDPIRDAMQGAPADRRHYH